MKGRGARAGEDGKKGVAANVVSYSTVISAYVKTGDIAGRGARRALARIEAKGVAANVVSYNF